MIVRKQKMRMQPENWEFWAKLDYKEPSCLVIGECLLNMHDLGLSHSAIYARSGGANL